MTQKNFSESSTKHYKLQPWQEKFLRSYTGAREGQINLVVYGHRSGKSMMLEYMKQTGKLMEDQQDQSETD